MPHSAALFQQRTIDTLLPPLCRLFLPLCHFTSYLAHLPFRYRRSVACAKNTVLRIPVLVFLPTPANTCIIAHVPITRVPHSPHRAHFLSMTYIYPSITILLPSLVYLLHWSLSRVHASRPHHSSALIFCHEQDSSSLATLSTTMTSITQLLSPWPVSKHSIVLRDQPHYPPPHSSVLPDSMDAMPQHQPSPPTDATTNDAVTGSAESDQGEMTGDGRKGFGKRELSTSKRAAQNRAAQVGLLVFVACLRF